MKLFFVKTIEQLPSKFDDSIKQEKERTNGPFGSQVAADKFAAEAMHSGRFVQVVIEAREDGVDKPERVIT